MKKNLFLSVLFFLGLIFNSNAQGCLGTSQYPTSTLTPNLSWQAASSQIYAGEYSLYNVIAGITYEWSLCTSDGGNAPYDSELTLTNSSNTFLAYNDNFCGNDAKIFWTATFTGTVRVHVTAFNCQTNSTNTTLVYRSVSGGGNLPNLLSAGGGTFNIAGTVANITVNIKNNGSTSSGAFNVRYYISTNASISAIDDNEIYVSTITNLVVNTTTTLNVSPDLCNIPGFSPNGTYYIGFLIDEPNMVTESDETDNGYYFNSPFSVTCSSSYNVTTNVNPAFSGNTSGDGTYSNGQSVSVTAIPNTGWIFNSWQENGAVVSNNQVYTFTIASNRNLVANFIQQHTITATVMGSIGGTVIGGGLYNHGQQVTVVATPAAGWLFKEWSEDANLVATTPIYTFTAVNSRSLQALFEINVNSNHIIENIELVVSPNPTTNFVNVFLEHPTFDFDKVQVYNIHGQLMQEANMNRNNSIQMDLSGLSEGVYFIQIFTVDNQQFVIDKIIKTN